MLLATIAVAPAEAKKHMRIERSDEIAYDSPVSAGIDEPAYARACYYESNSCIEFPTLPTDRYVEIEIVDATGLPVPAFIQPHTDDGDAPGVQICGQTEEPFPVVPGFEIIVWLNSVSASLPCAGLATTGVVKAVFSNRP
jgi:hypothetical protein